MPSSATAAFLLIICSVVEMAPAARAALAAGVESALTAAAAASSSRPLHVTRLTSSHEVTKARVLSSLFTAAAAAKSGAKVVVFYNGHGDRRRDAGGGDEADGFDEFWRLCGDGTTLVDDEITAAVAGAGSAGSTGMFTLISDSCSSGTMIDDDGKPRCPWASIGSCTDAESAFASSDGGIFTIHGLIPTLRECGSGGATATPRRIAEGIARRLSIPTQHLVLRGNALDTPIL